jgi:hypothetical protein
MKADKVIYYCDQCGVRLTPPTADTHQCPGPNPARHEGLHCPTCQCNKLRPVVPMPENPRSRSWHKDAPDGPLK